MKGIMKKVEKIMLKNKATRGDDDLLYVKFLKAEKFEIEPNTEKFLLSYRKKGIPTVETVGRARRKVQEKRPELLPESEIVLKRRRKEADFYNFSKK